MNEDLRRALLRARLSEEDVAARLGVDPKTVRRWLEGRVPYLRYRWSLAAILGTDEADLWPQLRAAGLRSTGLRAVYPHRDAVPREAWLRLFGSAQREIAILEGGGCLLADHEGLAELLAERAQAGVAIRICLAKPTVGESADGAGGEKAGSVTGRAGSALDSLAPLRESAEVEIRLHRVELFQRLYRSDDRLLISQTVYGIPAGQAPVFYLDQANSSELAITYLNAFDGIWSSASPLSAAR